MANTDEKLENLKGEVDALQIEVMSQRSPWFKNISIWVSIAALLFSFGTTVVSFKRTEMQDIQNTKSELRSILQRLTVLPTTQFELSKKYECDKNAIGFLGAQISQESTLLAKQAAYLAEKLPHDVISSTEYGSIALALQNAYQLNDAEKYYKLAKATSESVNDEVAALRGVANLKLLSGEVELGRMNFNEALKVFDNYPEHNTYTVSSTHIWTYLIWSTAEAGVGRLDFANIRLNEAQQIASQLMLSPGRNLLEGQIAQTKAQLNSSNKIKLANTASCKSELSVS
ncbi:hypothetical protein HII17_00680 [Thalassotalea sp. M1531]|uniref:Tetratricopeptide repeat protein n=1 Tax=Thalassotalea algicola TaxID=2716224 RepID=A0A7Y0LAG0_9GAMM|nr:hypothetical protein [Thalassotalea algicola]NMP30061.1 hypothetical protein [Thalassotalea algicola]